MGWGISVKCCRVWACTLKCRGAHQKMNAYIRALNGVLLLIRLAWTVCANQWLFYIKRHSVILLQIGWQVFKKISVNWEVLKVMCEMYVKKVKKKKNYQWFLWIKIIPSSCKCLGFKSKNKLRNRKTNKRNHFTNTWS